MSFGKKSAEPTLWFKSRGEDFPRGKMFPEIGKSTSPIDGAAKGRAKAELAKRRQFTKWKPEIEPLGSFLLVPVLQGRVGRKHWKKKKTKKKTTTIFEHNLPLSVNALKKGKIILNKYSLPRF